MSEPPSHEENIIYLLFELERTLAHREPKWTPAQAKIAQRLASNLGVKIAAIAAGV